MPALQKRITVSLIGCILILSVVFGCKPSTSSSTSSSSSTVTYPPPTQVLDSADIFDLMRETGISAPSFAVPDAKYVLPTRRWVEQDFSGGLWQFQNEMGISRWVSESNDCDKFALAASFYAKWLNHSSPNRNVAAGLAIGEVYYLKGGVFGQGHAINFFIVGAGITRQIVFYEPQIRQIVTLTPAEITSIFFWKL